MEDLKIIAANKQDYHTSRLSVAPMMDWTDRHCRYFHRLLSHRVLLYTEMVTATALVRGKALHLLDYSNAEHPLALQLGGADPKELAAAAKLGQHAGYDEINLNVGCPSDRVQSGRFGAVLMETPELVAECCAAMRAAVDVDVTVKCRIGVDKQDPNKILPEFIGRLAAVGVNRLIVHARKAWLQGLSPKENREVPPLNYGLVREVKAQFPDLQISVNGGVTSLEQAKRFLDQGLDGVMIGRAVYHRPYDLLAQADDLIFEQPRHIDARDVVHQMLPYIEAHLESGGKLHQVTRHMLGLFNGQAGARKWRRTLSEQSKQDGPERVLKALGYVERREAA